jgi:hypothetical protein
LRLNLWRGDSAGRGSGAPSSFSATAIKAADSPSRSLFVFVTRSSSIRLSPRKSNHAARHGHRAVAHRHATSEPKDRYAALKPPHLLTGITASFVKHPISERSLQPIECSASDADTMRGRLFASPTNRFNGGGVHEKNKKLKGPGKSPTGESLSPQPINQRGPAMRSPSIAQSRTGSSINEGLPVHE